MRKKKTALGARDAEGQKFPDKTGHLLNQNADTCKAVIRAELTGDDTCTALSVTACCTAPVLALCRKLIDSGHDPATPLHAYRRDTLALIVRAVGEAAQLVVTRAGFRRASRAAP